jgi:choline dehydrogenase-like flavoprotein
MSAAQLAKTTNGKPNTSDNPADELGTTEFDARVEANQRRLAAELQPSCDFIVCGSGSSGSVVARRLAESGRASVLLLEAGGTDDVPSVREARQWLTNFGTERHWDFQAAPNPLLNGRRLPLNMGKVLGGSSSINGMIWSRGHKNDWDYFAGEAGDPGWSYESVLGIYRRIEDWQGTPDPQRRGKGGLVYVEPARDPNPMAPAMLEAVRFLGIPTFDDQNGEMMEGEGGAAITNLRIRDGRRLSVFRTYTYPYMDRSNLAVLTGAEIVANTFSDPADMTAMIRAIELCREIGNSAGMSPFVRREIMPGNLKGGALESFVRDATSTFWHYACTAKMGRDEMSVVDSRLKVYGIDNLRVVDASVMPRVTTGNTMATCVVIGERAAELIRQTYRI